MAATRALPVMVGFAFLFLSGTAQAIGNPFWDDAEDTIEKSEILIVEHIEGKRRVCTAELFRMVAREGSRIREFKVIDTVVIPLRECRR